MKTNITANYPKHKIEEARRIIQRPKFNRNTVCGIFKLTAQEISGLNLPHEIPIHTRSSTKFVGYSAGKYIGELIAVEINGTVEPTEKSQLA